MKTKQTILLSLLLIILPLLNSCIGVSLNIQLNKDGSGKLAMEYRISKMLDNLGALDGNESMPTIPLSKADFEKTINRVPGAKLSSFSSTEDKKDTIVKVVVDFKDDQTLIALLDPLSGKKASINRQGQNGNLNIMLLDDSVNLSEYSEDVIEQVRVFFEGYNVAVSFSGQGNSKLTFADKDGNAIPAQSNAKAVLSGKKVSYSIGVMDLVSMENGLILQFAW
jgi:hypothetical protein